MSVINGHDETAVKKDLVWELGDIAERRRHETFNDPNRRDDDGRSDVKRLAITAEIVERLETEKWRKDPSGALSLVVSKAIDLLPGNPDDPDDVVPASSITYRRAAEILFGFVEVQPKDGSDRRAVYKDYVAAVKSEADFDGKNFTRDFSRVVRVELAAKMLKMWHASLTRAEAEESPEDSTSGTPEIAPETPPKPTDNDYIRRPQFHEEYARLIQGGEPLILLYGEGGVGKSRLAYALAREHGVAISISANDADILHEGMASALGEKSYADDLSLRRRFRDALRRGEIPVDTVIVDDVDTQEHLKTIVPSELKTRVVITARKKILPEGQGSSLLVGSMEDDEARSLARQWGPHLREDERTLIISTLGYRALGIKQAAVYLEKFPQVSAKDFCQVINNSAARILTNVPTGEGEANLTALYRAVIGKLHNESPLAYELLSYVVYAPSTRCTKEILSNYWQQGAAADVQSRDIIEAEVMHLIELLEGWCLLTSTQKQTEIHPLTQVLLRDLLRNSSEKPCNAIIAAHTRAAQEIHARLDYSKSSKFQISSKYAAALHTVFRYEAMRIRSIYCGSPEYGEAFSSAIERFREFYELEVMWERWKLKDEFKTHECDDLILMQCSQPLREYLKVRSKLWSRRLPVPSYIKDRPIHPL